MQRLNRLTAILLMLQGKRIVTAREIADRFEISLRTVYRDVRALEDAGVPVGSEAGIGYFLAEGYHLPPVVFSKEEAAALLMSRKLLDTAADTSVKGPFDTAMDKIRAVMRTADNDYLDNLDAAIRVRNIPFETGIMPEDRYLATVQQAIAERQVLSLIYRNDYKTEETRREVEPLGLVYYSSHWHLVAWCRLRQDYRDFRMDKVTKAEPVNAFFRRSDYKSLDEYLTEMARRQALEEVVIRLPRQIGHYISVQKYYQGFVQEHEVGDKVEMRFMTYDTYYFARWLLTFTNAVEVIKPDSLTTTLRQLVLELTQHYFPQDIPKPC